MDPLEQQQQNAPVPPNEGAPAPEGQPQPTQPPAQPPQERVNPFAPKAAPTGEELLREFNGEEPPVDPNVQPAVAPAPQAPAQPTLEEQLAKMRGAGQPQTQTRQGEPRSPMSIAAELYQTDDPNNWAIADQIRETHRKAIEPQAVYNTPQPPAEPDWSTLENEIRAAEAERLKKQYSYRQPLADSLDGDEFEVVSKFNPDRDPIHAEILDAKVRAAMIEKKQDFRNEAHRFELDQLRQRADQGQQEIQRREQETIQRRYEDSVQRAVTQGVRFTNGEKTTKEMMGFRNDEPVPEHVQVIFNTMADKFAWEVGNQANEYERRTQRKVTADQRIALVLQKTSEYVGAALTRGGNPSLTNGGGNEQQQPAPTQQARSLFPSQMSGAASPPGSPAQPPAQAPPTENKQNQMFKSRYQLDQERKQMAQELASLQ